MVGWEGAACGKRSCRSPSQHGKAGVVGLALRSLCPPLCLLRACSAAPARSFL